MAYPGEEIPEANTGHRNYDFEVFKHYTVVFLQVMV